MLHNFNKQEKTKINESVGVAHGGEMAWLNRSICLAGYIHDLGSMSARDVCTLMGVSRTTLSDWGTAGCPRKNGSKTFDLAAVIQWRRDRDKKNRKKTSAAPDFDFAAAEAEHKKILKELGGDIIDDKDDPLLLAGNTYYQELGRKRVAELARIKIERERGNLISAEEVHSSAVSIGARFRSLFELAEKHFGVEVGDFLRNGLDDIEREFPA